MANLFDEIRKRYQGLSGKANADRLNAELAQAQETSASGLRALRDQRKADIASTRDSAIRQFMENAARMKQQAQRNLKTPVAAPDIGPSLDPLQQITGVQLNDDLAGTNAATASFFINPESTQSQFNVGAPTGGGGLGIRQRASTDDLQSSGRRALGGGQKDEF